MKTKKQTPELTGCQGQGNCENCGKQGFITAVKKGKKYVLLCSDCKGGS